MNQVIVGKIVNTHGIKGELKVKASTDLNPNLYLGILEFRDGTTPDKMGYGIKNPETNGTTEAEIYGAKIWKIVRYNSDSISDVVYNTDTTYYCVKAGVGFSDIKLRATYDKSYDFIKDRKEIFDTNNKTLQSIVTTDNDNSSSILSANDMLENRNIKSINVNKYFLKSKFIFNPSY